MRCAVDGADKVDGCFGVNGEVGHVDRFHLDFKGGFDVGVFVLDFGDVFVESNAYLFLV